MEKHKYYELAVQAFSGTSFSPEKRAESYCADHDQRKQEFIDWLNDLETDIDKEAEIERFKANIDNAFNAYLGAHSRVMSTMITGPANFPVNSNRKRGDTADRRMSEYLECTQKAKDSIMKRVRKEQIENAGGELEINKKKLEGLVKLQEAMKKANSIIRKAPKYKRTDEKIEALVSAGFKPDQAEKLFTPDCLGGIGFHGFQLTNNNAKIKNTEQRIRVLEARENAETTETEINGIKIVENTEIERMQLIFDGKPEYNIREELKRNGFKWSPREGAWQRKLTNNARWTVKRDLSFLQTQEVK